MSRYSLTALVRIVKRRTADGGTVGPQVDVTELHLAREEARAAEAAVTRARCAVAGTGNVMPDPVMEYYCAGFVDTLPKPIRREQLIEDISRNVEW